MKAFNRAIQIGGESRIIGTPMVTALEFDSEKNVTRAKGATVPTDGDRGFAVGCLFTDTDSGLGTTVFVNEGSTTSAKFRRVGGTNAASDLTAASTLTAADSGKVFFLNSGTEFATTLPAVAAGLNFRFFVKAAPSGASYTIVTASSANVMIGSIHSSTGGNADSEQSGGDTFTFADGAAVKGDRADFFCDGTNWYVTAFTDADAGATITTAS